MQLFEGGQETESIEASEVGDDDEMEKDQNKIKWDTTKWENIQVHTLVVKK